MPDILTRRRIVVESLLENEALRESLDDDAAQAAFAWLLPCAERLVETTADIDNDEAADEAIAPRLKALRKLLRQINQWIAYPDDDPAPLLETLLSHAQTLYGDAWTPPDETQQAALLRNAPALMKQPRELICQLRTLLEGDSHAETPEARSE